MIEAPHYSAAGAKKKAVRLPAALFDGTVNEHLLHRAVITYLANQRQGTHDTRTRSEVSGGNQKPWRQKGTGRARQGSTRAPHWRHGGIVFGPHPRSYRLGIPKKMRQLAKKSALNARAREGALFVVDALEYEKPKTKTLAELLAKLGIAEKKVLVVTAGAAHAHNVYLSGRNLPKLPAMRFADATAYEMLWADAGGARQAEELRPVCGPPAGVEEGDRDPQRGRRDPSVRGLTWAFDSSSRSHRRRGSARCRTSGRSRKRLPRSRCSSRSVAPGAATTRATSRRGTGAAATSGSIAASTSGARSSACRPRWRRSNTTRTGRRASPCCSTPTARSATSWRPRISPWATRSSRGRAPTSASATPCRCSRFRSGPRCTTWSSRLGAAASWPVRRAPACRWWPRKAITSRCGSAPRRCGWCGASASPRSGKCRTPSTSSCRSARRARAAGWGACPA